MRYDSPLQSTHILVALLLNLKLLHRHHRFAALTVYESLICRTRKPCLNMSPAREEPAVPWSTSTDVGVTKYNGRPRNIDAIDAVKFAENLQPPEYQMLGTHAESRILFLDVNILDSTGAEPYRGDVLIKGLANRQSTHVELMLTWLQ